MPNDQYEDTHSLNLERYVPALVTFLANKLSTGASSLYRELFGIGIVEWRLISLLVVENGISANRMCQVIGLDKSGVSRSLKFLENEKYVYSSVDPEDARRFIIWMTNKGRALHDKVFEVAIAREKLLLEGFSKKEVDTLIKLLNRLNDSVSKVNSFRPNLPK
ncbi:winged helix-turn-helix transcriptional regulator [Marinomonas sp. M1K-6]|uniref:Winged helix-turn-helix transcriptional regulator n=1 Tax=Marinomonas profundi TaxID=2726122 RepID=A0A847RBD1_9GAMM|nr:MarR family winged helix-turn-helix transcriptional regulator [Marinomonas profundi]NLQ18284.1 winged helix-turn-helix transcriptional regulator [Marinomonas profundi]UDV02347.1 winged helix-turn-helix transcriptional regulator [Marinomonas profundi]